MHKIGIVATLLIVCTGSFAQQVLIKDDLLEIVDAELKREVKELSKQPQPPYFISYRIVDSQTATLSSSFGSIVNDDDNHSRMLFTDVKVGSYSFDDSHPSDDLEGLGRSFMGPSFRFSALALDNRPEAVKTELWQQTQRAYRQALASFKDKKNATKVSEKQVNDFSKESPVEFVDEPLPSFNTFFSSAEWNARVKKYSAPFLSNPDIIQADAHLSVGLERKYFVSSEGSLIAQNRTYAHLSISATVRTEDGDAASLHQSYFAFDPKQLPAETTILKDVETMMSKLDLLKKAPVAEPYAGPAILYSHAAGVFFHEIFGHRVEGHRLKNKNDGQTFKGKMGERVLPKTMSVVFDPQMKSFNGQDLNGTYIYDDQGVKGERVVAVDHGVLKSFLMSRTPIEDFSRSNGHGRGQVSSEAVSRQSNLIIENEKTVPMSELRKMLLAECTKQNKAYGYLIMDVIGGFTMTQRTIPNAFNIFPTEVYRVYVDGRPDELVRGVDLIGTPLAMFSEIQAADNKPEVFTGFCGAESGSIPVTATSPSLFVRQIETQKKAERHIEKTVLPSPTK